MSDAPTFLADIAIATSVAALTGMLARALKQPTILGYLLAGLIVGPSIPIPLFADPHRTEALAEFGVVFVMFAVGLEFRVKRLLQVLPGSGFAALVQIAALGWAGFTLGMLLGWGTVGAAFLGSCLAISSTMVVSGIFREVPVDADVREHVLGVLVVQDIVAIALIALMTALAAGQSVGPVDLGILVARLGGTLAAMLAIGMLVVPRLVRRVVKVGGSEGTAVLAVGLAFGFALLAQTLGYSVALGAFVAGMLVAESGLGADVEHAIEPLRAVFAAIFFVSIGMAVDPLQAVAWLPLAVGITALVIVAQLISVAGASVLSGKPLRRSILSGVALGQIGELSFILAGIGIAGGVAPEGLLPTLVAVATMTSFTTPALLRQGDRLVGSIDRWMPQRLQLLIAVLPAGVARLRGGSGTGLQFGGAVKALALDWLALVVLAVTVLAMRPPVRIWMAQQPGALGDLADPLLNLLALAIALPLLVGLYRNCWRIARLGAQRVAPPGPAAVAGQRTTRLFEALAILILTVGVGLPALAVLRPLVEGPWGEPVLLLALTGAILIVWRNLGAMEGEFRTGVEDLAHQLARHAGGDEAQLDNSARLPGLDRILALPCTDGAFAVGRTLAELDLRARSGATVVAIHKSDAAVVLPTGHERLEAGDVLALAGDAAALERAKALLVTGPG